MPSPKPRASRTKPLATRGRATKGSPRKGSPTKGSPRKGPVAAAARTHVAFLRGVMPTNCNMEALRAAFERAGFTDVLTVLGSGNVVFGCDATDLEVIAARAEAAMKAELGRSFTPYVRTLDALAELVARDPFARFVVPQGAKRDVTFLPRTLPDTKVPEPIDGAAILAIEGAHAFSFHVPRHPEGPVFMKLFARTFGEQCTTRSWDTLLKVLAKR